MNPKQTAYESAAKGILKNLKKRNMDGYYFSSKSELANAVKSMLPEGCSIGWGGSESVKEAGIMDMLLSGNYSLIDRSLAKTPEESRDIYAKTVMADYYFMSTNAITYDGELINIDGTGNRVACLIHGPKYVFVIAGMNKVVQDIDAGIFRSQNMAAPPNAKRLNRQTPCNAAGTCGDCLSPDCMCSQIVITRRSMIQDRIKVFLVGEELGY